MFDRTTWFGKLFGFEEEFPEQVRDQLSFADSKITSAVNSKSFGCGELTIPTLRELREVTIQPQNESVLQVSEVVGNVQELHQASSVAGATFQVASQFNLLEMVGPSVPPENGVGIYQHDMTQGPACAVACGAATVYRNYFVPVGDQIGQTESSQIDCLDEIGAALGNEDDRLWAMRNGYALGSADGLTEIGDRIQKLSRSEISELEGALKIRVQTDAEVTLGERNHQVTQVFCSATPVAYSHQTSALWEPFARLVLNASYEAAFRAAIINSKRTGNWDFYLTLLGGGAFGNPTEWITDAILRSLNQFRNYPLTVKLVSYGSSSPDVNWVLRKFNDEVV